MTDKVTRYTRIKYALAIAGLFYTLFLILFLQLSGLSAWLRAELARVSGNYALIVFLYSLIIFCLYTISSFPFTWYRSYIVEHQFEMSNEHFGPWLADVIKATVLNFLVFIILAEVFFNILLYYPKDWWWMASLFWILLSIVLARLFPVLVVPLFFKYKRIENESLRKRILDLSDRMRLKVLDIYEIDFSKKSVKANAGLMGLGKSKRVLLTDTLQGKFSEDEIEVILAHEFAHFKLKHLIKLVMINSGVTFLTFYGLYKIIPPVARYFRLPAGDIAGFGMWLFLGMLFQIACTPVLNWISRTMERNADIQAITVSEKKDAFISMLEKLSEQNLSERKPQWWAKVFFYDHPPIDERIALARERITSYASSRV